jgi:hypothetical protein
MVYSTLTNVGWSPDTRERERSNARTVVALLDSFEATAKDRRMAVDAAREKGVGVWVARTGSDAASKVVAIRCWPHLWESKVSEPSASMRIESRYRLCLPCPRWFAYCAFWLMFSGVLPPHAG